MADDLKKLQLRVLQYEFVDGTFEFSFGALCLLFAVFLYIQAAATETLLCDILFVGFFFLGIPGGAFLIERLARQFRERITYPRTGFIAPKRGPEQEPRRVTRLIIRIGVPVLVAVIVTLLVLYRPLINPSPAQASIQSPIWILFTGLTLGGVWMIVAWRIALPRFYLLGIITLLMGFILPFTGAGTMFGMALFFGLTSLILLIFGGVTLLKYLRQNPAEPPDEH